MLCRKCHSTNADFRVHVIICPKLPLPCNSGILNRLHYCNAGDDVKRFTNRSGGGRGEGGLASATFLRLRWWTWWMCHVPILYARISFQCALCSEFTVNNKWSGRAVVFDHVQLKREQTCLSGEAAWSKLPQIPEVNECFTDVFLCHFSIDIEIQCSFQIIIQNYSKKNELLCTFRHWLLSTFKRRNPPFENIDVLTISLKVASTKQWRCLVWV